MSRFGRFLARDGAVLGATVALLWLERGVVEGWEAHLLAIAAGVLVAVSGFLAHEWGHLLGAVVSGGSVRAPERLVSVFLFAFDTARSTRRQFLMMSYGGYLGTALSLVVIAVVVDPTRLSGLVAWGLVAVGVLATLALEIPTTVRVARGGALPTGGVYASD